MREVTKDEFSSQKEYDQASLITKDNKEYQFDDGDYTINSDTLTGSGLSLSGNNEMPFSGKIALDDVTTFNLDKLDVELTILVSALVLGFIASGIASWNSSWGGFGKW
jgi:hypothetical protein